MWRHFVDHKRGDTQGNVHFVVIFNGSVFSRLLPCIVAIKVDFVVGFGTIANYSDNNSQLQT